MVDSGHGDLETQAQILLGPMGPFLLGLLGGLNKNVKLLEHVTFSERVTPCLPVPPHPH